MKINILKLSESFWVGISLVSNFQETKKKKKGKKAKRVKYICQQEKAESVAMLGSNGILIPHSNLNFI